MELFTAVQFVSMDSPPPGDLPSLPSLLLSPSYSRPGSYAGTGTPSRGARPSSKVSFRADLGPPSAPRSGGDLLDETDGLLAGFMSDMSTNHTPSSSKGKKSRPQHSDQGPPPASPGATNGIEMLLSMTAGSGMSTPTRSSGNKFKGSKSTTKGKGKRGQRKQLQSLSASKSSSDFLFSQTTQDDAPPPSSDFLDSFHFVSHMLHRTTEVSGGIPDTEVDPSMISKKVRMDNFCKGILTYPLTRPFRRLACFARHSTSRLSIWQRTRK